MDDEYDDFMTEETPRPRRKVMDFAPRTNVTAYSGVDPAFTERARRRRELAKKEVERREQIQRQIQEQNEADIVAKRRAIAARKELARRQEQEHEENIRILATRERELELQREQERIERERHLLEQRALDEQRQKDAARRAMLARKELARRRAEEEELRPAKRITNIKPPVGSSDPLSIRNSRISVKKKTTIEVNPDNVSSKRLGDVDDFEAALLDLDKTDAPVEKEISARNPEVDSYKPYGQKSPFINTTVDKRPLASPGSRYQKTPVGRPYNTVTQAQLDYERMNSISVEPPVSRKPAAKPAARSGRFVPYDEPVPHKHIYEKELKEEKTRRGRKDTPAIVATKASKGSSISLIIAILLTITLGVAVGAIIYFAFFQQG